MPQVAPFSIHQLGAEDAGAARDLLLVFSDAFNEPDTYQGAQPSTAYLEELLCSDCFIALAALRDGAVIGGLAAYELRKFEQARTEIYIYDLAVAEDHRRQGIATALIEKFKTIASGRGAHVIFVQADLEDGPAIQLYSKLGKREDVLHFDIDVT